MTPHNTTSVSVALFAGAKQAVGGQQQIVVTVPDDCTASELLQEIGIQYPELKLLSARSRLAVNTSFVSDDEIIDTLSELAMIPPVSGG